MRQIAFALTLANLAVPVMADPPSAVVPLTTTAPAPEKLICHSDVATGSLIKSPKTCRTKQQWATLDRGNQAAARGFVDRSAALPQRFN